MISYTTFSFIKKTRFQLTMLFVTMIYIVILLFLEQKRDSYAEPFFHVEKVEKSIAQVASNVTVGLHINNFSTFSFYQNDFKMDALVWFKFPIGTQSLDTIENFDFENGEITHKSNPIIKLINQDVLVTYQIKLEFKAPLIYKYFPTGDHRLTIILNNKNFTPHELCFNSKKEDFSIKPSIRLSTWKAVQTFVEAGYIKAILKKDTPQMDATYPCVVFTIDFENTSSRDLITLYFPMYIIFFIGLFSLMLDIKEHVARIALTAQSIPILVLFRMVILQLAPSMGEVTELTRADFVYFLLVFCSLLILMFQAYEILVMKKIKDYTEAIQEKKAANLEWLSSGLFVFIIILLISALSYNAFYI